MRTQKCCRFQRHHSVDQKRKQVCRKCAACFRTEPSLSNKDTFFGVASDG